MIYFSGLRYPLNWGSITSNKQHTWKIRFAKQSPCNVLRDLQVITQCTHVPQYYALCRIILHNDTDHGTQAFKAQ